MMPEPDETAAAGPYADHAHAYLRAGWSPLPLPPRAKKPVPDGWTGRDGAWPSGADVHAWTEDRGDGNIALRLPPHVVGIDVDAYGDKPGGLVLAELERDLGPLPPTWRSTSRDDGVSGIRLYTVPPGRRWPSTLGPGIDVIRHEHRYVVAPPSVHPDTQRPYRWIGPDGIPHVTAHPAVADLPALPAAWVERFAPHDATQQTRAGLDTAALGAWLTERGAGTPCRHTQRALADGLTALAASAGGSRHDAALTLTNRLAWTAGEGHTGAAAAMREVAATFLAAVAGDRAPDEARAELDRMISGAIDLAAAAHPTPRPDPCTDPFAGLVTRGSDPCSAPANPTSSPTSGTSVTTTAPASGPTTPSTSPWLPPTASPSTSASEATSGPADGAATPPASTSTTQGSQFFHVDQEFFNRLDEQTRLHAANEVARLRAARLARSHLENVDRDHLIAERVRRRELDDEAAKQWRIANEPPAPSFDAGTLADVLARPDEPPMRCEGLIPWGGSTLIVAARKAGKTTTLLNYVRCLLTGEPFLGEFDVIPLEPGRRIAFLNYEVGAKQLARWAADLSIDPDRLFLVNLRGRRNPLSRDDDRADLAALLREQRVETLIVDPFGRAFTGDEQNSNTEVQQFLTGLDQFARTDCGAGDLVLAAHAGWDGERTRGASALEDWPDTIVNLVSDEKNADGDIPKRFMKALGRDVDVSEDEVVMDPMTRVLRRDGTGPRSRGRKPGARRDAQQLAVLVTRVVNATGGATSQGQIKAALASLPEPDAVRVGDGSLGEAIALAEQSEFISVHRGAGPRKSHVIHRRDAHCSHCSHTALRGVQRPPLPTPVGGSGGAEQSGAAETKRESSRVVERTVGGERVTINLDTGEVIER